ADEVVARENEATARANDAMAGANELSREPAAGETVADESTRIGTVLVALRDDNNRKSKRPPPSYAMVRPELLEASVWLLATVKLPKPVGIRETAHRDCYTCQNPRCRAPRSAATSTTSCDGDSAVPTILGTSCRSAARATYGGSTATG